MQFADPKNDVAFRKIFGNENKREILISFLNATLKLENEKIITWIEILNPYQLPRIAGSKSTILDVRAKDKAGNTYIVEMQVTDKKGLDKRVTLYEARGYANQINSGDEYMKLKPVIFIGILNFDYFQGKNYISRHLILDSETYEHKLKDLEFNFIELTKFNKKLEELETLVEKWVYFIKHARELTVIPSNVNDKGLEEAYNEASKHNWTKEELNDYEYAAMRETDEIAEKELAEEKAREKGMIEGKIYIAKEMKNANEPIEKIAKYTGLTIEEIEKL